MTEIKLDKSTLPKDNQTVKWQTHEDFNNEVWEEGVFCEEENLFLKSDGDFDISFNVFRWTKTEFEWISI